MIKKTLKILPFFLFAFALLSAALFFFRSEIIFKLSPILLARKKQITVSQQSFSGTSKAKEIADFSVPAHLSGSLPLNENLPPPVAMLFFGDSMLDRSVRLQLDKNGFAYLLDPLAHADFFAGYDLVGANLEGAVTTAGRHYPPVKTYDFAFRPADMAALKNYGFTFFNLANNHFADQGAAGMAQTRQYLSDLALNFSGCAGELNTACATAIVILKSHRLGLIGLNALDASFSLEWALEETRRLEKETDLVIVNIHWGEEYQARFNAVQQKIAHSLIDAGADLLIGHHPHVVQGIEFYKKRIIFYSLGNFIFDQYFSEATQTGLAVAFDWSAADYQLAFFPLRSSLSQVSLLQGAERAQFFKDFSVLSSLDDHLRQKLSAGDNLFFTR